MRLATLWQGLKAARFQWRCLTDREQAAIASGLCYLAAAVLWGFIGFLLAFRG